MGAGRWHEGWRHSMHVPSSVRGWILPAVCLALALLVQFGLVTPTQAALADHSAACACATHCRGAACCCGHRPTLATEAKQATATRLPSASPSDLCLASAPCGLPVRPHARVAAGASESLAFSRSFLPAPIDIASERIAPPSSDRAGLDRSAPIDRPPETRR